MNNLFVINMNVLNNPLLPRDFSFVQQSFTYKDFNIILFALSIAIVSNDAK